MGGLHALVVIGGALRRFGIGLVRGEFAVWRFLLA